MNKYNRLAISGMILILVPSILLLVGIFYSIQASVSETVIPVNSQPPNKNVIIKTDTVKIEIPCTRNHCDSHKSKKHQRDTLTNRGLTKDLTDTL